MGQLVSQERAIGRKVPNHDIGFAQEGVPRIRNLQAPSVEELVVGFPEEVGGDSMHERVVHLFGEGGAVLSTSLHAVLSVIDPLYYPLLFPHGDTGWYVNMRSDTKRGSFRVTMQQFYFYKMVDRGVENILHKAGCSSFYVFLFLKRFIVMVGAGGHPMAQGSFSSSLSWIVLRESSSKSSSGKV